MKINFFLEKVKLGKFGMESENLFENRGNLKQGECIIASMGMDASGTIQCSRTSSEVSLKPSKELIEAVLSCLKI